MNNYKTLVFFSSTFPNEVTLKNEFFIMSKSFDKVYYIPTSIKTKVVKQTFPSNIELIDLTKEVGIHRLKHLDYIVIVLIFLKEAFLKGNFKPYLKNYKMYLYIAKKNILWAKVLKNFICEKQISNAVYYDYWFENVTLALSILKKEKVIKKIVTRAHGFDLYDNRWGKNTVVPFRNFKMKFINSVYTISTHGKNYFKSKVNSRFHHKIKLSYLGVQIPNTNSYNQSGNEIIIVSASHTRSLKRVHLIPESLSKVKKSIHWVHFGSGPNDDLIQRKVVTLPSNIKVTLMGQKSNCDVLDFYFKNNVSGFISLSENEGLPISMMEAIAHGIPVFACNINGIPDLINEISGSTFELTDSIEEITIKLNEFLEREFDKSKIIDFAKRKFNVNINYQLFYKEISRL